MRNLLNEYKHLSRALQNKDELRVSDAFEIYLTLRKVALYYPSRKIQHLFCLAKRLVYSLIADKAIMFRNGNDSDITTGNGEGSSMRTSVRAIWPGGEDESRVYRFHGNARDFYDGLLRAWLEGGKCSETMFQVLQFTVRLLTHRALRETPDHFIYLRDFNGRGEELEDDTVVIYQSMCYLPGLLRFVGSDLEKESATLEVEEFADSIAETCLKMYDNAENGLAGEAMEQTEHGWLMHGAFNLRSDLAKMLFQLWRFTGEERYREAAWQLFVKIDTQCRMENGGYAPLKQLENKTYVVDVENKVPDWYIASTIKYVYLTLADNTTLPLEEWSINERGNSMRIVPEFPEENRCGR